MSLWYETHLEAARDAWLSRQCEVSEEVNRAADAAVADVVRKLNEPKVELEFPDQFIAKPKPWWYWSITDDDPRRFVLWRDGQPDDDAIQEYLATLENAGDMVETDFRLYAAASASCWMLDHTLASVLDSDRRTRRSRLTQKRAVQALYGALRTGRYRGVMVTDIRQFDRTVDRAIALDKAGEVLERSRIPDLAKRCVLEAVESLGESSQRVYQSLDPQHADGRGFLSGLRLMQWLTWVLSLELRRKWRARGHEVFGLGEDVVLLSEDVPTSDDYERLVDDVRLELGQELHSLDEGDEQAEEDSCRWRFQLEFKQQELNARGVRAEEISTAGQFLAALREAKLLPPRLPHGHRPLVGRTRDGFRFVGFEFQQIGRRGVRIRISQRTHHRLVWAVKRATRGAMPIDDVSRMERARRTARRLAFILGTEEDPRTAKLGFLLSCWKNREISLQMRSLDKVLGGRIVYALGGVEQYSRGVDVEIESLHNMTGIRINSFARLLATCHTQDKAPG